VSSVLSKPNWLLQSESPTGMCAKLSTVAASNNRYHVQWSLFAYTSHYVQSFTCQYRQSFHATITLMLLVHATYIWCCSLCTFRSGWTAHSVQRQLRGCNTTMVRAELLTSLTVGIDIFHSTMFMVLSRNQLNMWHRAGYSFLVLWKQKPNTFV